MENSDTTGHYVPFDHFLQQYQAANNQNHNYATNSNSVEQEQDRSSRPTRNNGANPKKFSDNRRNGFNRHVQNRANDGNARYFHNQNRKHFYDQKQYQTGDNEEDKKDTENNEKTTGSKKITGRRDYEKRRYSKRKPAENDHSQCSQREKLVKEIENNTLECLVCCEIIRDYQATWSCPTCFHIFHLKCIKQWQSSSQSDDGSWRCPACQNPKIITPKDYYCFCGKTRNPTNKTDLPHSCGEVCGTLCDNQHPCTILCHPGPHIICQALFERSCHCGKQKKLLQCNQKEDIKCDGVCGKLLSCNLHCCDLICHSGPCKECPLKITHTCFCGQMIKDVECSIENEQVKQFSCKEQCNKLLKCGNHHCSMKCHDGACDDCPYKPELITTCPCGRSQIMPNERQTCKDPIMTCKNVCKKPLPCGNDKNLHFCSVKCHLGNCPPCNKKTTVRCRCGTSNIEVKCKELLACDGDVRCKKKCNKMRSCFRHKCNETCCIDNIHNCHQICNKLLSCGKHRCVLGCHAGNCLPCDRASFDELTCECGSAVIYPPVPCGTKRPPCEQVCSRTHTKCNHPVLHNCHTEPLCPPCVILTTKWCHGKHEQRKTIPCHEESFSCGMPCNKPLSGCDHKCQRTCHLGPCMGEGDKCKQKCIKLRFDCNHICAAPCHIGDCPDISCKENVEVQCECGHLKRMRLCHDFANEYRRIENAQLASTMQDVQNGAKISLKEVLGCTSKRSNKTLECNNDCKTLERNRRLELAFGPRDPAKQQSPPYSEFLKSYARKDMNLVKDIHTKLTNLVKLAKESKQKSRSYSFEIMNREKRQVVHEMCEVIMSIIY